MSGQFRALVKALEESGVMGKIISPWDASGTLPDKDGPHMVKRGGECEGAAADPEIHKLAHYLMDKFAWFEMTIVTKEGGCFWARIRHSYPTDVDIESYVKAWAEGALKDASLPVVFQFLREGD